MGQFSCPRGFFGLAFLNLVACSLFTHFENCFRNRGHKIRRSLDFDRRSVLKFELNASRFHFTLAGLARLLASGGLPRQCFKSTGRSNPESQSYTLLRVSSRIAVPGGLLCSVVGTLRNFLPSRSNRFSLNYYFFH